MIRKNLDFDWLFANGAPSGVMGDSFYTNADRYVNLPHDFTIETDTYAEAPGGHSTGYYGGGIGTYTKYLELSEADSQKRILVEFDGSYMNTTVSLNGNAIALHHYGYTPFHADLTPYFKPGQKNRLAVTVNNTLQPNTRWYSGSGLYRHVDLLLAPKLHIAPWGIYAHTSHIVNGTAFITVEISVENHNADDKTAWIQINANKDSDGSLAGTAMCAVHIPAGQTSVGKALLAVPNAELWDIDSPNLYKITAVLDDRNSITDSASTLFGIRTISVDPVNGFMLNGRTVNLKGGCIHHDNGILGAASFKDSEYRKMKLHKDHGYNAIRCAHNPPSRDMLEACDRLGLLVIDEAFDMWTMGKNSCDYNIYFETDWQKDMKAFMLRDRNHPCIIMWSTGNEIIERGGLANGYVWAAKLAEYARSLDSTRPIINAVCGFFNGLDDEESQKCMEEINKQLQETGTVQNFETEYTQKIWGEHTEAFLAPLDVAGYNYLEHRYESDAQNYPGRVICCTESMALDTARYWDAVERLPYVIGDFNWTSFDYIGEAAIGKTDYFAPDEPIVPKRAEYPYRLANDSDFDLCGNPRPQLFYRKIVWGSDMTFIASHRPENHGKIEKPSRWGWPECEHSWSWNGYEEKPVLVDVYSAADEVELILNGQSLGKQPAGKQNNYQARFDILYKPGTLKAVSYCNGQMISSDQICTAGSPAAVRLVPESKEICADGQSLSFVSVEIVDADGNLVPTAELKAAASVEGAAVLAAFGTGNPITTENYTKGQFTSYKGRFLAIIRAGLEPGTARLTVQAEGLPAADVEITITE